jgi:hypothetical protein
LLAAGTGEGNFGVVESFGFDGRMDCAHEKVAVKKSRRSLSSFIVES